MVVAVFSPLMKRPRFLASLLRLAVATARLPAQTQPGDGEQQLQPHQQQQNGIAGIADISNEVLAVLLLRAWVCFPLLPQLLQASQGLIRSDTLSACSLRLADAASGLPTSSTPAPTTTALDVTAAPSNASTPSAPQPQPARSLQPPQQPLPISPTEARAVLRQSVTLIEGLAGGALSIYTLGRESGRRLQERALALCSELASALDRSAVLEHAARLLLLLAASSAPPAAPGALSQPGNKATASTLAAVAAATAATAEPLDLTLEAYLLCRAYVNITVLFDSLVRSRSMCGGHAGGPDATTLDHVLRVMTGRCVQHAIHSLGLAVLSSADGAGAYGLPPALLARLPVLSDRTVTQPFARSLGNLGHTTYKLQPAIVAIEASLSGLATMRRPAPPGMRGALALALRACRLALAASSSPALAAALAAPPHGASSLAKPHRAVSVAASSLYASFWLLRGVPDATSRWPAEMAEWWALGCETLRRLPAYTSLGDCGRLQQAFSGMLTWCLEMFQENALTPRTPPDLQLALSAGLLPCMERLIRLAAQHPPSDDGTAGGEVGVLLCGKRLLRPDLLFVLLAYGEPAAAAALIATIGKLLRTIEPLAEVPFSSLQVEVLSGVVRLLELDVWKTAPSGANAGTEAAAASDEGQPMTTMTAANAAAAGAAPPGGRSNHTTDDDLPPPLSRQSRRMLSLALLTWLPPLARIASSEVQRALLEAAAPPAARGDLGLAQYRAMVRTQPVLRWIPLLAAQCGGVAACGGSAADGDGDVAMTWRHLLLRDLDIVQLLAAALRMEPADPWKGYLQQLAAACCAVATTPLLWGNSAVGGETWPPEALQGLATRLRKDGLTAEADGADALATKLEGGVTQEEEEERLLARVRAACAPGDSPLWERPWVPPAEARALLRVCANPSCVNLAGDSEAGLALKACSGCGAVGYCGRACQTAHWRGGHKEACEGRRKDRVNSQ